VSRGEGELLTVPKPRAVGLLSVCLTVKPVGEPDALIGHVRFDERGWETERCRMAQATAPILDSTLADNPAVPAFVRYCEGFRMPADDGRRREHRGLGPAFENLQGRKSREWIREAVPRALWRFGCCAWGSGWEPMGLSSPVDENGRRARPVSAMFTWTCRNR
jgi:hypothetical protein